MEWQEKGGEGYALSTQDDYFGRREKCCKVIMRLIKISSQQKSTKINTFSVSHCDSVTAENPPPLPSLFQQGHFFKVLPPRKQVQIKVANLASKFLEMVFFRGRKKMCLTLLTLDKIAVTSDMEYLLNQTTQLLLLQFHRIIRYQKKYLN